MNNPKFSRKIKEFSGLSLAELLISVTLIGLILLVVSSVDITSRKFYSRAEKGVVALNDITLALEYIERSAQVAIGDVSIPAAIYDPDDDPTICSGEGFKFRIDTNQNGIADTDGSDAPEFQTFCFDYTNHTIEFDNGSGFETICRHLASSSKPWNTVAGGLNIKLLGRDDFTQPVGPDNPDVSIETTVFFRSASLK